MLDNLNIFLVEHKSKEKYTSLENLALENCS